MKRCPICGAVLKPEELLPPYCGAVCAACDALSEAQLEKRYPVWFENLPSLSDCYKACKRTSTSGLGSAVGNATNRSMACWVVVGERGALHVLCHLDDTDHELRKDPKTSAALLWRLIRRQFGLEHCWTCHEDHRDCVEVQDCGVDTGMRACPTCVDKKIKSGHW